MPNVGSVSQQAADRFRELIVVEPLGDDGSEDRRGQQSDLDGPNPEFEPADLAAVGGHFFEQFAAGLDGAVPPTGGVAGDAVEVGNSGESSAEEASGGGADAGRRLGSVYRTAIYTGSDVGRDASDTEEVGLAFELPGDPAEAEQPTNQQHAEGDDLHVSGVGHESVANQEFENAAADVHRENNEDEKELKVVVSHVAGLVAEDGFDLFVGHGFEEGVGDQDVAHGSDETHHGRVDGHAVRVPEEDLTVTQTDAVAYSNQLVSKRAVRKRLGRPNVTEHDGCERKDADRDAAEQRVRGPGDPEGVGDVLAIDVHEVFCEHDEGHGYGDDQELMSPHY